MLVVFKAKVVISLFILPSVDQDVEVCVFGISAKNPNNLEHVFSSE
jgi:hypothetical protein